MNKKQIYVADFETIPYSQAIKEGAARIWLYCVKGLTSSKYKLGMTIQEFINDLASGTKEKYIYFHNLSFDGDFILHWAGENLEYCYNREMSYAAQREFTATHDNFFTFFKDNKNTIYQLTIKYRGYILNFHCSYKLLNSPVERLPNINNSTSKLVYNYDYRKEHYETDISQVDSNEIDYIKNDVLKVEATIAKLIDTVGTPRLTASSMAYYDWEQVKINKRLNTKGYKYIKQFNTLEMSRFYHKWYNGGLTYLNPKHKNKLINHKIYTSDVNSLYPDRMYALPMPFPLDEDCLNNTTCDHLQLLTVTVTNLQIKEEYIPFIQESRYSQLSKQASPYIKGISIHFITDVEYKQLIEYYIYDNITVSVAACFTKRYNLYKHYIDYWFEVKCASKGFDKMHSKLMLNGLYGKNGTKPNKPLKIFTTTPPAEGTAKQYGKYYEVVETWSDTDYLKNIEKTGNTAGLFWNPLAIFITAYSRVKLIDAIQANRKGFIYCDTDSITSLYPIIGVEHDEIKLGAWKDEGEEHEDGRYYYGGIFLNKKQYIKFNFPYDEVVRIEKHKETGCNISDCKDCKLFSKRMDIRICGMSSSKHYMVTTSNFKYNSAWIGGKLQRKAIKGGICLIDSDFTIKDLSLIIDRFNNLLNKNNLE